MVEDKEKLSAVSHQPSAKQPLEGAVVFKLEEVKNEKTSNDDDQ